MMLIFKENLTRSLQTLVPAKYVGWRLVFIYRFARDREMNNPRLEKAVWARKVGRRRGQISERDAVNVLKNTSRMCWKCRVMKEPECGCNHVCSLTEELFPHNHTWSLSLLPSPDFTLESFRLYWCSIFISQAFICSSLNVEKCNLIDFRGAVWLIMVSRGYQNKRSQLADNTHCYHPCNTRTFVRRSWSRLSLMVFMSDVRSHTKH